MYQDTASLQKDFAVAADGNDLQTLYTGIILMAHSTTTLWPTGGIRKILLGAGNSVPDATHSDSQFQYLLQR